MAGVCRNQKLNASLGVYELRVQSQDSNVVLQAFHAINGNRQSTWDHSDLFNRSQTITVQATERHQTFVIATFTNLAADSKVTVTILQGGVNVMDPCELTPRGLTSSSMSILTPVA